MHEVSPDYAYFDTERLKGFSDAVFAIVITLLVLELEVPDLALADQSAPWMLFYALAGLWPKFASYFASFILVGIYWVAHNNFLRIVDKTDRALLWLNLFYLMAVSLVAFSSALMGTYNRNPLAGMAYGLNLMACGLVLLKSWTHAISRGLTNEHYDRAAFQVIRKIILLPVIGYALATVAGFVSMHVALGIYLAIPLAYVWPGVLERFAKVRPAALKKV